jgi:hypothetical protein
LQRARDEHELFFRQHPTETEREYLLGVFEEIGRLPGLREFFDRKHNPLWLVAPSGDACRELWQFWQKTKAETGALVHDFSDPEWNTRFLGDLYQDLSEAARKRYALLQTPVFIEQFILDRTLTPAIETFGFRAVRMIDPTCGSGHFLLGGFERLFRIWQAECPGENPTVLAQRTLDQVFGVDLNPNVIAIARFRLLLAALNVCAVKRLADAPDFRINLAAGDSLLHGARFDSEGKPYVTARQDMFGGEEVFQDELRHHYEVEDVEVLHRILGQQYHAVVGNPPYITVKDRAVSELYRARYSSCHRKYSLSVPFMERFFDLATRGGGNPQQPAGFVGQITANSFMKREFGKKLIEEYLPHWDLTHVLDTSGAYIPGHGTPTVILFGKNQPPVSGTIRTVLGIEREPGVPSDPTAGVVWQAIREQIDRPGTTSKWVSTNDSPRVSFEKHPWSIGGGGVAELKEQIDESGDKTLLDFVEIQRKKPVIGFGCVLGEDEIFQCPRGSLPLNKLPVDLRRPIVEGDLVRDWMISWENEVLFPYNPEIQLRNDGAILDYFWTVRVLLSARNDFGKQTYREAGRPFWEYHQIPIERNQAKLLITFGEITTHNHFVLDRGGKVFNRTAPIIKLKENTTEAVHITLLGVLNSSTACFWMRQVCFSKDGGSQWEDRFGFNGTQIANLPIPAFQPTQIPTALVKTSTAQQGQMPAATLASWGGPESGDLLTHLACSRDEWHRLRRQMIAWQEELDWQIYAAYGLISEEDNLLWPEDRMDELPPLELGERTFEIFMARQMARGTLQTTWFERHARSGSRPITEPPQDWPKDYLDLYHRRHVAIQENANLGLIERPEYKRRWNTEPWDEQFQTAARNWLLLRLETYFFESERMQGNGESADSTQVSSFKPQPSSFPASSRPHLVSANQLADVAQTDKWFMEVAENYVGSSGFSVPKLVRELVESESVPYLPVLRYKESGLRKRQDWEHVWELQRREDEIESGIRKEGEDDLTRRRGDAEELILKEKIRKAQRERVGDIPVPPKYASADFLKTTYWKLRGKLDVPKERWLSYPGAERAGDDSLLIAWAGWDHLQQAQALAEYYIEAKDNQGWPPERLKRLLAGIADLIPWLKQWHNEHDPTLGMGLGDYFAGFLEEQCRGMGSTVVELDAIRLGTRAETR